jgi:ABC-type nitrate/sulfonate/bicarbonate transport system ATPase subunit
MEYPVASFAQSAKPGFQYYDHLPFEVRDITVRLSALDGVCARHASEAIRLTLPGNFKCEQGELVTCIGPHCGGKSLLLRILGGVFLPELSSLNEVRGGQARLLIPPHLRVLHVSQSPLFMLGSIEDNLASGCREGSKLAAKDRIVTILTQLGVSTKLLDHKEVDVHWNEVLSESQKRLLSIARALIANPDVLIMQQPLRYLEEATCTRVMRVLKEFVDDRGVALKSRERPLRRPKTCIMTTGDVMSMCYADRVFLISQETGIRLLTPDHVKSLIDDPYLSAKAGATGCPKHMISWKVDGLSGF